MGTLQGCRHARAVIRMNQAPGPDVFRPVRCLGGHVQDLIGADSVDLTLLRRPVDRVRGVVMLKNADIRQADDLPEPLIGAGIGSEVGAFGGHC